MRKLLLLIPVLLFCFSAIAQHASVKGVVIDTINKQNLTYAAIALLNAKDSTLEKFARSNEKGEFELKGLTTGNYILMVAFPEYADYTESITLTDTSAINTGAIKLILKANLLKEVIVKQQLGSIRIKGDTTEFIADSFKVQANANVEDLLKKIPGIQVDKNGKITAEGQTVKHVLVEGEEFFGDDPTLVTQNLRADMVGSIQVYDKKSDQAAFTGIDDGKREKTINLKLKDGKKNGYFGKVNLAGGTDGYYDNQVMANIFKNKMKFAAYGILSNIGKTGLNWDESSSYGDNPLADANVDDNGGISVIGVGGDFDSWNGTYNGQGYPKVQTGGVHFNNKWDDDKQSANLNYKILQLHLNGETGSTTQTILHDTVYYSNDHKVTSNQILRNKANGSYELKIDSTSSIKISVIGAIDHKISSQLDSSDLRFTDSSLVNQSRSQANTTGDKKTEIANILWRKKLKKKGRTISLNIYQNYTSNNTTGYLRSTINTFAGGGPAGSIITDQYKTYKSENTSVNTSLTYSEPLSKSSSLVFNYGINVNNSTSQRSSFNKSPDGKYTSLDSFYSNNYRFNTFTQRGGLAYSFAKKKLRISAGNDWTYTNFTQTDLAKDTVEKRSYLNWNPQASVSYNITPARRIDFWYNGYTEQPGIEQIQPVHVNDDPLHVILGNPNLKPAFSNYMSLNYEDYKQLTGNGYSIRASYSFYLNQISDNSVIDTAGRTFTKYVNLNGNHSFRIGADYGIKIKAIDTRTGIGVNYNTNRGVNISNGILNTTNSNNYTTSIYLSKDKEAKYSISFNASATYTNSVSSIQTSIKTNYWTYDLQPNVDVFLPLKFQIHADGDYSIRQQTAVLQGNHNVFLLNGWLGKKFLKNDGLLFKITGNDILNQNIGFNRQVQSNIISQNTYSTIRRYFMLSLVWNFNKTGGKNPGQ